MQYTPDRPVWVTQSTETQLEAEPTSRPIYAAEFSLMPLSRGHLDQPVPVVGSNRVSIEHLACGLVASSVTASPLPPGARVRSQSVSAAASQKRRLLMMSGLGNQCLVSEPAPQRHV